MLKSYGWGWGGLGGPCDFSVSPSPIGLDFGTLDFRLGLDNHLDIQNLYKTPLRNVNIKRHSGGFGEYLFLNVSKGNVS